MRDNLPSFKKSNRISLVKRIAKIKLLAMDVDGVLTDGKIIYDNRGGEIKNFDVQDGYGIVFFQNAGFKTAIITARSSKVVTIRAQDLKIHKILWVVFHTRIYYILR